MRAFCSHLAIVLAILLLNHGNLALAGDGSTPAKVSQPADFVGTSSRLTTESQSRVLTVDEQFELSVSLFGSGQFSEALLVGRMGLGRTRGPRERSMFYLIIAQCHGALGNYRSAGEAALEGQRLEPLSKELAALRLAYFTKVDDKAQVQAAADTLAQIIPGAGEQPVCLTQGVIAVVRFLIKAIEAGVAIYEVGKRVWPEVKPQVEVIAQAALKIWQMSSQTTTGLPPSVN